jgi:hypothetical protein
VTSIATCDFTNHARFFLPRAVLLATCDFWAWIQIAWYVFRIKKIFSLLKKLPRPLQRWRTIQKS